MAVLNRQKAIDVYEVLTPADLHELVEDSQLQGVVSGDLLGADLVNLAQPSPAHTGDNYINSDRLLEFYYDATWTAPLADPLTVQLLNDDGNADNPDFFLPGEVVVASSEANSAVMITDNNTDADYRVIGACTATIAKGDVGPIAFKGIMQINIIRPASTVPAGSHCKGPERVMAGLDINQPESCAGTRLTEFPDGNLGDEEFEGEDYGSSYFAVTLEEVSSVGSDPALVWVKLYK